MPTALVTGATGAIGYAICQGLAQTPGFDVVLVGRDKARTRQAAERLRQETGNEDGSSEELLSTVRFELADLSREQEIYDLAARWDGPLHVLINNAAATPPNRRETPEGIGLATAR